MNNTIPLNPGASNFMKISKLFPRFILPLSFLISFSDLHGQVGDNNPTGPAGMFNGNVTTGGSYDPYTGNVTRTVVDMVVAGAVGQYGLSYSRTWNSRAPGWSHSFNWYIDAEGVPGQPQIYDVGFPDGRQERFTQSDFDVDYRAVAGVRERLEPWTSTNGDMGLCSLVLPDGGKVEFSGTRETIYDPPYPPYYAYQLTATAIIDPYGQRTTLEYANYALSKITEPAGRSIQLFYVAGSVDYIRSSDGREVHYTYQTQTFGNTPYTLLTNVAYYADSSLNALYTYQGPNVGSVDGQPLLASCDDPMYAGPMKKISYGYRTKDNPDGTAAVYGQISVEKNGTTGQSVSVLNVTGEGTRTENRGDGRHRTFTYIGPFLYGWTDFKNVSSSQAFDGQYVSSATDGNGNRTDLTNNQLTGVITQIQYPATPNDTLPPTSVRGISKFNYGHEGCLDGNNQDINNPYYLCNVTDEAGNVTALTRDSNKRITRIDYADSGYETFSYDPSFGQMLTHRMKTGGTETFTYDGRGLRQTYSDAYHSPSNPTASYQYDALDRLSGVTDTLGLVLGDLYHTTNYAYNTRGQLMFTTLPIDPRDGVRHTIQNTYNPNGDGTLLSVTDQLNHTTSYTYDDYRRVRSVTTAQRFPGDTTARITGFSYDRNQGTVDDYTHTDSNVTRMTLPSTNITKTTYDENFRKIVVTASGVVGTDAATTSYVYDNAGNVTSVLIPDEQPGNANAGKSTVSTYDERNRLMSVVDPMNYPPTVFAYDAGGRKKMVTQPNGQTITYDIYDVMNRVRQQTAKQTPEPDAVTQYTYEPLGLLMTMKDPRLFGTNYSYAYTYDLMGREIRLAYPPDSGGFLRSENFAYDTAGRLQTYTNRANPGQVQTFTYDALNRRTGFSWLGGSAPSVTFIYDAANRLTSITNTNAAISRTYYDDNLLKMETETPAGMSANMVTYSYNADGNRDTILYPSGRKYLFAYTGRDQIKQVQDFYTLYSQAQYVYDVNGSLATRKVGTNVGAFGVVTDASQRDPLGRCTHLVHQLTSMPRTFDYVYDAMSNRTSIQRGGGTAESYVYDLAQQVTAGMESGNAVTYGYDANGNRTTLNGGWTYVTNSLNQQTTFFGQPVNYDPKGNVITGFDGSATSYVYDAQNRLTSVTYGSTTSTFKYDGLNRKISRTVGGVTTYNVWDGWNLIEERGPGNALLNTYLYGAGEIVERISSTGTTPIFYFQDGLGSTSHVSDATGSLLESYTYGTFGTQAVYDPNGVVRHGGSIYDIRHLFTGQLWMPQTGLYDYRNRVYSPTLTRFLQPDPIGHAGDPSNLYRYCGNNAVNWSDPMGRDLVEVVHPGSWFHTSFGITDPTTGRMTWFDFSPNYDPPWFTDTVPGHWDIFPGTPAGIGLRIALTPEQDLVALDAYYAAADPAAAGDQSYNYFTSNCIQVGERTFNNALFGIDGLINPLDPYTGNIFNAYGNWVGWENLDTGNIYNSDGNWAGWNPHWEGANGDGGGVSSGTYGGVAGMFAGTMAPNSTLGTNFIPGWFGPVGGGQPGGAVLGRNSNRRKRNTKLKVKKPNRHRSPTALQ